MLSSIVTHTPIWVWGLLLLLLMLGFSQTRARSVGMRRILILPLVMTGLSLSGTVSSFGLVPEAVLMWALAIGLTAWLLIRRPAKAQTRYDSASGLFHLPGSWQPMALILGIFTVKYAVGTTLALHPEMATNAEFSIVVGGLYGALSGVFMARAGRLWKLSLPGTLTALAGKRSSAPLPL